MGIGGSKPPAEPGSSSATVRFMAAGTSCDPVLENCKYDREALGPSETVWGDTCNVKT